MDFPWILAKYVAGAAIIVVLIFVQLFKYGKVEINEESLRKPRLLLSLIGGVFLIALVLLVTIGMLTSN